MACAASKRSLPYSRGGVNPRRPEKSQVRARCAWRAAVDANPAYSPGAKTALRIMDDLAGWGGMAYPRHVTLARQLGRSRQSVQRYVAELERGGEIVRVERAGRAVVYVLRWASHAHQRASLLLNTPVGNNTECAPRTEPEQPAPVEASLTGTNEPEKTQDGAEEPERECPRCGGTGEREYRHGGGRDSLGRLTPVRVSRGPCGCQWFTEDRARSATVGANAVLRDGEK